MDEHINVNLLGDVTRDLVATTNGTREALALALHEREDLTGRFLETLLFEELSRSGDETRELAHRLELLRLLSLERKRYSYKKKVEMARDYILEHAEDLVGWTALIERGDAGTPCEYQLDREFAWWAPGDFRTVHEARLHIESKHHGDVLTRKLELEGFRPMTQAAWRAHIKGDLMVYLMTSEESDALGRLSCIIRIFTTARLKIGSSRLDEVMSDKKSVGLLKASLIAELLKKYEHRTVAIPHQPMATLPKESNNLGMISALETPESGAIKLYEEPSGQLSLLVYDRKLVVKDNDVADTFIRIPLPRDTGEERDDFEALLLGLRGLEELGLKDRKTHFQDIPRVIAGMFLAASQDMSLGLPNVGDGEFWDSDSAIRLTELIGLNRGYAHHKQRVARVRNWLMQIVLERSIRSPSRGTMTFQAPIVQRLQDQIRVTSDQSGGLRAGTYNVWRLDKNLWRLRNPKGPTASFMLLDERAFRLETRSSEPFNLYWTIVQRAYNAMRASHAEGKISADGVFSPKLSTLYEWAGMEKVGDTTNPFRIRERLREALGLMVSNGLLLDWSCPQLENDDEEFRLDEFKSYMRVRLTLPGSLVRYLPREAFLVEETS